MLCFVNVDTTRDMVLVTSLTSPYGRKVRMAASVLGLESRVSVQPADTRDPDDPLRRHNPLGKMPVLLPYGGEPIYDSWVILEYFNHLAGGDAIVPANPARRFPELTRAKLADGVIDASLLITYERRYREPHQRSEIWLDHQRGKLWRALGTLEGCLPGWDPPRVSGITLACALHYMDWRSPIDWRERHQKLGRWLDDFAGHVPAVAATTPPQDA
jgi:glutathione S-transferase